MKAIIINIGNELLNGSTLNKNGFWLAGELHLRGIETLEIRSIRDGYTPLKETLEACPTEVDLLFFSGGLGPTPDDTTRADIAKHLGIPLVKHEELTGHIVRMLGEEKAKKFQQENQSQTYLPEGASILENEVGTAAGFELSWGQKKLYFTPGVPFEMQHILEFRVFPYLHNTGSFYKRELRSVGMGESVQTQLLQGLEIPQGLVFSSLPGRSELLLRLAGSTHRKIEIDALFQKILGRLTEFQHCWTSIDGLPLIEHLKQSLIAQKKTLSVAESCTGGLLGSWWTQLEGSSAFFKGGVIAYSNEVKKNLLQVKEETLTVHGAVSLECATEMALGAQKAIQTDFALSITGIAGPTGGTKDKPVGTVCFSLASDKGVFAEQKHFRGDRERVRERAASYALFLLHKLIHK